MTYQYDLSQYSMNYKSNFLAFNIRSGGNTHDRIVELALVLVKDGEVFDKYFSEILPPPSLQYDNDFRQEHYKNCPTLKEIWKDVKHYFEETEYITAFNLSVHKSNLEKSLNVYGIELPKKKYFCMYNWAKDILKEVKEPVFENICEALKIDAEKSAYNSLSKAIAVAEMLPKMECIAGAKMENIYADKLEKQGISASSFFGSNQEKADLSELEFKDLSAIDEDYFNNKGIVVTGIFERYPDRKKLEEFLKSKGGVIKSGISVKTNIVVIGNGAGPSKIAKIKELISAGSQIDLINEQVINNLK